MFSSCGVKPPASDFQSFSYSSLKTTAAAAKSHQSCLTLCDPMDGTPPGFPVPGILQARILEWVTISFSDACMHASVASVMSDSV